MTLFLVSDGDRELYVALEREDRFYVYDPHTGSMHQSMAVWRDFHGERALIYRTVDLEQARALITAGAGDYDVRVLGDLLRRREEDAEPLQLEEAFGQGLPRPPATEQAASAHVRPFRPSDPRRSG